MSAVPCVVFEDDHLLVVNKPAGWNTHAPSPYAVEGIYDWLRNREPRWAALAIIHRLDKETSGILLFARTPLANRSLTEQFTARKVLKKYRFLTASPPPEQEFKVESHLVRAGEKYFSRSSVSSGERAETQFRALGREEGFYLMEAQPLTGRTHQIRVHAADRHIPILGDTIYGGEVFDRLCLHACEIAIEHPSSGELRAFSIDPDFHSLKAEGLRSAIIDPARTNAFRLVHGRADGHPGFFLERWGDFLLAQSEREMSPAENELIQTLLRQNKMLGAYHKLLRRSVGTETPGETMPRLFCGTAAPEPFLIVENGVKYEISFEQGYSVGLFLDQRDNRRRLMVNHVGWQFPLFNEGMSGKTVLNTFAYTCGFSVCAALAGGTVTSLDLSKKYLDWGRRNFIANRLDPARHDFIFGDVFEWAMRLAKKGRKFDLILLDPPTFSRSKNGTFQAERDYGELIGKILPLLTSGGVLFCSTNSSRFSPESFEGEILDAAARCNRNVAQFHYSPQTPDFPVQKQESLHLKTAWLRCV